MNEKLIRSLKENPVKYAIAYGWKKLRPFHNEWLKLMLFEKDDYTLLGHRESFKTTCLSFAIALLMILRPDKVIFFIRKTDDAATEIVNQVRLALESELFKYLVKQIYGVDLVLTVSTQSKIDTNLRQTKRGQVQLQGMGLTGNITGKHADFIFTDDIVDDSDRNSVAERKLTIRKYQELHNVRNRGGRIFNTGTPWHPEDCIATQMTNVHKWTVYDTGLFTKQQLDDKRLRMTASLFAANYELEHIEEKDAMFKQANWLDNTEANKKLIYNGVAHIDAAYDGEDFTAFTILKQLNDGRIIGYGKLWDKHVDKCLPEIKAKHTMYRAGIVANEKNADKGYLADKLQTVYHFPVFLYSESTNKYVKIATYLLSRWNDIWWIADTDPDYIRQILAYNATAKHDDAPDSAASLLRYMTNQPRLNRSLKGGI